MARQQPGLACEECRRRKARCDRGRPQCGICADAGRECVFVDKRAPRGPKKGQLKDLRSRVGPPIAEIEQRLISQDRPLDDGMSTPELEDPSELELSYDVPIGIDVDTYTTMPPMPPRSVSIDNTAEMKRPSDWTLASCRANSWTANGSFTSNLQNMHNFQLGVMSPMSPAQTPITQMTLGEDLSMSELMLADLYGGSQNVDLLYFERVHPIVPMIHKERYFSWTNDENVSPSRICLRSAMRTIAAAMSSQFCAFTEPLYARTRHMLEMQEVPTETGFPWMAGSRDSSNGVEHELIQAWLLLAHCELMRKSEQEALLTAGHAFTLLQFSHIIELDMPNVEASPPSEYAGSTSSTPPYMATSIPDESWMETEEKRRTLWAAFVFDRLSSMLNDRPAMLHEEIIQTRLPMPETDFQGGRYPVPMGFLPETMSNTNDYASLPSFAHTPTNGTNYSPPGSESQSQDFWTRHEWLASAATAATMTPLQTLPNKRETSTLKCDSMDFFNHILAYSALISLSETAEQRLWQNVNDQMLALAYKQAAYQAANDVVHLIQKLPRVAFFKMHPFLPNSICLVAQFLTIATSQLANPAGHRQDGVQNLIIGLRQLSDVNNLARESLMKLEAGFGWTTSANGELC
ncbi:hypothetical protein N7454_009163 [Penicillium verhagenii]|nr:hypothetical protein N7454_009163 [Penicillium verhagenii]